MITSFSIFILAAIHLHQVHACRILVRIEGIGMLTFSGCSDVLSADQFALQVSNRQPYFSFVAGTVY